MNTTLKLRYLGPAVEAGSMDVYHASANMIAFSEFMVVAAKATYGPQVETRAEVAGFARGSFATYLFFTFIGQAATVFSALSPNQLLSVVNEAFTLWKHLKGQPPKSIERTQNQTVHVTNNNGQVIQVQTETVNLVFNEKASEAVRQFVQEPLSAGGIDALEIRTGDDITVVANATQQDAQAFQPVLPVQAITDITIPMTLILEAPVFKEGNKWRFSDGQSSFFADLVDRDFLARVDKGERFGKGDLLRVDLRITQDKAGSKINTERAIIKVHEHKSGQTQMDLL